VSIELSFTVRWRRMRLRLLILLVIPTLCCAASSVRAGLPAPNPNGCFVFVYDRPNYEGARDVLNGPGRWQTLDGLAQTSEQSWRNRIRSLRVGNAATLTVYSDGSFTGASERFGPETNHPILEPAFSGRIESLELTCQSQSSSQ
jgi:hypothetical protein